MRHATPLFIGMLLLSGCAAKTLPAGQPERSVSSVTQEAPLEQVPAELSIEHFSRMRLEGTDFALGAVQDDNAAYVRHTISYRSNGLLVTGIMNIPKGEGPFPLLVLNHGYIDPAVYTNGRGLKREQDFLARKGFAVLHTDYRGHAGSDKSPDTRNVYDAGLEYAMDSVNAILAVREANIARVDASKVGMLGHSMGGGVTLNILTAFPDLVDAAVLYAPVHADAWENFTRWRAERDEGDRTVAALGTRDTSPETWDALSSQTFIDNIGTPVLLFHGTNDKDVPVAWSDSLSARLTAREKHVRYVVYRGEGHEFARTFTDFMNRTADFFRDAFGGGVSSIYEPSRITKKDFGFLVDPETSPVQPERFRGFHTGADFELREGEDPRTVAVTALCDGTVSFAGNVNGYGGVVIHTCTHDGETVTVLYGHLAKTSIVTPTATAVKTGQLLGYLGAAGPETDGERAHLHLAVHKGNQTELRGYVEREEDLLQWISPVELVFRRD